MILKKRTLFPLPLFIFCSMIYAASHDTLQLSLPNAEKMLQAKNLQLIAQHYNIDIAQAQVIQAKVFANPVISIEHNIYNPQDKKLFDISSTGETAASIEQVFNLAAQRSKQVKVAKINQQIAVYQYEDVVRALKGVLKSTFIQVYFLKKSLQVYDREIQSLESLVKTMIEQQQKGNISMIERVRLEAFLLSVKTDKNTMLKDYNTYKHQLNLLLSISQNEEINTLLEDSFALQHFSMDSLSINQLFSMALDRPDLKVAQASIDLSKANLVLQKSMRAPDFSLGVTYDKLGNAYPNYTALVANLSIPIFDRNQGNVRAAKIQVQQSNTQKEYTAHQVDNDVMVAYLQLRDAQILYQSIGTDLEKNFEILLQGVEENFRKRNISMLEFLDYYGSYKDAFVQLYQTKMNVFLAMENLNTMVGRNIINY